MFALCACSTSSTPAASIAEILIFTLELPPPDAVSPADTIFPGVSGINNSGPCSPTI